MKKKPVWTRYTKKRIIIAKKKNLGTSTVSGSGARSFRTRTPPWSLPPLYLTTKTITSPTAIISSIGLVLEKMCDAPRFYGGDDNGPSPGQPVDVSFFSSICMGTRLSNGSWIYDSSTALLQFPIELTLVVCRLELIFTAGLVLAMLIGAP